MTPHLIHVNYSVHYKYSVCTKHYVLCSHNMAASLNMCLLPKPGSHTIRYFARALSDTHTLSSRLLQRPCSLLPCLSTTQLFSLSPQGKGKELSVLLTTRLSRPKRLKLKHDTQTHHGITMQTVELELQAWITRFRSHFSNSESMCVTIESLCEWMQSQQAKYVTGCGDN